MKLDMHTHTEHSRDSRTPLRAQAAALRSAGIDIVCTTDHDTVDGGLRLREIADGFRVIVGEEVTSADGEIIGLFLERTIPAGLPGEETIERIREQGGVVVVPHPFSRNRKHRVGRDGLERLWPLVDAIEIFNARELLSSDNAAAARFAREHRLAGAVGSDAHRPWEIGRAWIDVAPFEGRADFVDALRRGTPHGRLSGIGAHVLTRYDVLRKRLARSR